MKRQQPEKLLQHQSYQLFCIKYGHTGALWHHSPNENLSTVNPTKAIIYNADLKRSGRQKGFPDIMILYKGKCLFIELKSKQGRQYDEQKEIEQKIKLNGFDYFVCRSLDEVERILDSFFNLID